MKSLLKLGFASVLVVTALAALVLISWSAPAEPSELYADDSSSLPDVSFLDGVLGGEKDTEAAKKIERDRMLVDAAKIRMKAKGKHTIKKNSSLQILGLKHRAKDAIHHLPHEMRRQFSDGELREREQEFSEQLREKEKEKERELAEQTRDEQLRKIHQETSHDLSQIQRDRSSDSWSNDEDTTGLSSDDFKDQAERLRRRLDAEVDSNYALHHKFQERSSKIIMALKKDSAAVTAEVEKVKRISKVK